MFRFAAALAILLAATVASAGPAERAADHRQRAAGLVEQGKLQEAALELRNAVQLEPRNPEGHRALGEVYLKLQDGAAAMRAYLDVVSLDPQDGESRLRVAGFYLLGRRFRDAAEHAEGAAKLLPTRAEPLALLARAKIGLEDREAAVSLLEKAIALAPDHEVLRVELAQLHLARGKGDLGERVLRQGIKDVPPSKALRAALANLLASQKKTAEADGLMTEVLNLGGDDANVRKGVALYRLKRGDRAGAEALLRKNLEAAGDRKPERLNALGELANFYSLLGDLPRARGTLEEIQRLSPDQGGTLARLANLHLLEGDEDGARPLVAKLLKQDPEDPNARLLKARLDIAEGKLTPGREALEKLVRESPDSVNGHLFLAKAYAMERRWAEAKRSYQRVLEEVPDHFFANLDLAKVSLELGAPADALGPIGAVLKARPDHPEARRIQADAHLGTGKAADAEKAYRDLLKGSPADALLLMRLGQALEAQGRDQDALVQYRAARKQAAKVVEPVLREMTLLARLKKIDEAEKAGLEFLKGAGDVPPVLNALAAHAFGRGKVAEGEGYLKRSLAADPRHLPTRELHARARVAVGDLGGARAALEEALKLEPQWGGGLLLLASLHEQEGRGQEARPLYERVLALEPGNPVAANNLAMLYAADEGKRHEALRLAQLAVDRAPENAFTLDTLGWVQHLLGTHDLASRTLEKAHQLAPEHPEIAYHLGATYAKLGRKDEAKKLLEKALAAPQKGPWALDAGFLLEGLKK